MLVSINPSLLFHPSPRKGPIERVKEGFPGGLVVMNPPADAGATGDMGSIPGSGRSPGGGNGNPLQYSCLENPRDRGAWWTMVHRAAESDMNEHTHMQSVKDLA